MLKEIGSASIGIIGGADGPTAIFVTSPVVPVIRVLLAVLILAALATGICVWIKKRRK